MDYCYAIWNKCCTCHRVCLFIFLIPVPLLECTLKEWKWQKFLHLSAFQSAHSIPCLLAVSLLSSSTHWWSPHATLPLHLALMYWSHSHYMYKLSQAIVHHPFRHSIIQYRCCYDPLWEYQGTCQAVLEFQFRLYHFPWAGSSKLFVFISCLWPLSCIFWCKNKKNPNLLEHW